MTLAGCAPAGPVIERPAGPLVVPADWTADAGIYGTYNHFGNPPSGPPTYLCGVAIRYPDGFLAHVSPNFQGIATGWQRASVAATGPGSLSDAARLGHASGSAGTVC